MDLTSYTDDDLANLAGEVIREADKRADALPVGPMRRKIRRALGLAHAALLQAHHAIADEGVIQPYGGTDKPDPDQ